MVRIALIDFVHETQIGRLVFRKTGRLWKFLDHRSAHRLPEHPHAADDGRRRPARSAEYLPGLEGIVLTHSITGALHRACYLVGKLRTARLPGRPGQITRLRGVATVQ